MMPWVGQVSGQPRSPGGVRVRTGDTVYKASPKLGRQTSEPRGRICFAFRRVFGEVAATKTANTCWDRPHAQCCWDFLPRLMPQGHEWSSNGPREMPVKLTWLMFAARVHPVSERPPKNGSTKSLLSRVLTSQTFGRQKYEPCGNNICVPLRFFAATHAAGARMELKWAE